MTQITLLEESFADVIAAVHQAADLPPAKRTHWECSLRQIPKALGVPPESLAARWLAVRWRIAQLHHARAGMEWKTLANHKSNVKAALHWFREGRGLPRRGTPLTPQWRRLRAGLTDRSRLAKLSGLIRFCSLKGILPSEVHEATLDAYMRYRAETTALAVDTKARRAIARAWNSCIGRLEGWPAQRLVEPPLKAREWPQWEDFPATLRGEFDNYLQTLTKPRRGVDGRRLRACAASTLRTKRGDIIAFAKMAVRSGTPLETLTSLSALLDPDVVKEALDAYWKKHGEEPGVFAIDLAKKLFALARLVGCLDPEALGRLDDLRANLECYRRAGLTDKNLTLVRQVLTDGVWSEVVNLPSMLMVQVCSLRDQAPAKAAMAAQIAVAIAILTVAPVRIGNLAAIRFEQNLIKPAGSTGPYWLVFPNYDVKNRVDLNFKLSDRLTALIDEYRRDFHSRRVRGSDHGWLFPGDGDDHKTEHWLGIQIKDRIQEATGLQITPHQFRHAAAALWLKQRPGDYESIRRVLGHRTLRTTTNFYCGLETIHATELFGRVIENLISPQPEPEKDKTRDQAVWEFSAHGTPKKR